MCSRMGSFCSKKNLLKLILGALSLELLYKLIFIIYCDKHWAENALQQLCNHYKNGLVDGNMCHALCVAEEFKYQECFNYRHRKLALKLEWKGRPVMLKALEPYLENFDKDLRGLKVSLDSSRTFDKDISLNLLRTKLSSQIRTYVQPTSKLSFGDIYHRMWTGSASDFGKAEMVSVGSLSLQREYIFLQFFKEIVNFPDVIGSCGHMYLVEYTPPTWTLNPGMSGLQEVSDLSSWTWGRRARLALGFLQMLRNFENDFHDLFYFCDIKHPNFGVTDDLTVKAIDVDMAYFRSTVETFMRRRRCTKETEGTACRFFDCLTECDEHTKRCKPQRINSNFQVVCKKIFIGDSLHPGLLRSPPIEVTDKLTALLEECAATLFQKPNTKSTNSTLFHNIQELLQQTIR